MKVENKENITIFKDTQSNFIRFADLVTNEIKNYSHQNIILDISHDKEFTINNLSMFLEVAKLHKKNKKSIIIVGNENLDYNKIPSKFVVVPSLQEAFDIIEMDEIERDLGF